MLVPLFTTQNELVFITSGAVIRLADNFKRITRITGILYEMNNDKNMPSAFDSSRPPEARQ